MRILLFATILFLATSCASRKELVGTWRVKNYSFFEQSAVYLKGARGMIMETELLLKPDSTFKKTSRVDGETGTWSIKKNKLLLKRDFSVYTDKEVDKKKSIQLSANQPFYLIKRDKLVRYYDGNSCSEIDEKGYAELKKNRVVEILK